jgi:ribosome recycling factor
MSIKDINLKNMYTHEFEKILEQEMDAPIKHFERELITIRSGRAHPAMVEDIKVTCYGGSQLALKELAAISVPEARFILIQPWDKGVINDVEKAILASPLGVTPANDGNVIRVTLPEISSQRRDELAKTLGKKLEDTKERIRVIRGDFRNLVKDSERQKTISEDFSKDLQKILQDVTDKFTERAEQMSGKKEKEIKSV